ncbi:MAG: transcription-repair coupling factor [Christensenellaceae bacterium]|jgi:transcription-repair coupling factor (superfamily II helicase)|nr:transcription-repair coupling factor [Christensenellaceae bacterium]
MLLPDIFKLENLGGPFATLKDATKAGVNCTVFSTVQNARYHITSELEQFFVYVAGDTLSAKLIYEALSNYFPDEIVYMPERDDVLSRVKAYLSNTLHERNLAISRIIFDKKTKGVVATVDALTQYLPNCEMFKKAVIKLEVNHEIDRDELLSKLALSGYNRTDSTYNEGDFVVRGDTIDIWPLDFASAMRVEFFGDTIETIRTIDTTLETAGGTVDNIIICPKFDLAISQGESNTVKKILAGVKVTANAHLAEIIDGVVHALEANEMDHPSIAWILPFIKDNCSSLFDYIPNTSIIVLDDVNAMDDKLKMHERAYKMRVESLINASEILDAHINSIIKQEDLYKVIQTYTLLAFKKSETDNPIFTPKEKFEIRATPTSKYDRNYVNLIDDIKAMVINEMRVFIYAGDVDSAELVSSYFLVNDMSTKVTSDPNTNAEITIVSKRLSGGFIYPQCKLAVIGTDDIIRHRIVKKKSIAEKKRAFVVPNRGDYVVHETHGVGLAEGVQSIETRKSKRDYFVIKYADDDKLFVPTDKMDTIEKYTGVGTPTLHKLGGVEFARAKERVKKALKPLAVDLVSLYEARSNRRGHKYAQDTLLQSDMENAFEFVETDDQLTAIAEIKEDMETGKIMDRLLCGDVGFGKTEVAMRAAFKTVVEGKQVVFLAPTTILCAQHYKTVKNRLDPFGVKVVVLSRFSSRSDDEITIEALKSGEADIVIGTHKVLSKKVKFKDLGLLILDEEQRFGVDHKEKIKALKNNVNVLTLSATPIPRTLHMSLSGIRDISTLETPPRNRLPIETYFAEYSDELVIDAVKREKARNGQTFILYNSIATIESYYNHIKNLLGSDIVVSYAHGRMSTDILEDRINDFFLRYSDVLIATTIIENGIDVPDANTLIVTGSDRLGLSDMYQLRGRVGRSYNLAYAYFTVPAGKKISVDAEKRLNAILNHTELGSGFKIALEDMEIRGVGNVLGREQHGNMGRVGYDMYCQLLKECIDEVTGINAKSQIDVEVVVDGVVSIPEDYISDDTQRIRFYKSASTISSVDEKNNLLERIESLYGEIPDGARNIVSVCIIKNIAASMGIKRVVIKESETALYFASDIETIQPSIFNAIVTSRGMVRFQESPQRVIKFNSYEVLDADRIRRVEDFLLLASEHKMENLHQI